MRVLRKNVFSFSLISFFIFNSHPGFCMEDARTYNYAPIIIPGGVVSPNAIYRIDLNKYLVANRYYKITCDIENPNYQGSDPVIMRLMSAGSGCGNCGNGGGVGMITLNGHHLAHMQALLEFYDNKYVAQDVLTTKIFGTALNLVFENYSTKYSVTLTNCIADYMVVE